MIDSPRSHLDIHDRRPAQTDITSHARLIRSDPRRRQSGTGRPDGQPRKVGRGEQDIGRSMRDGPALSTGNGHPERGRECAGMIAGRLRE